MFSICSENSIVTQSACMRRLLESVSPAAASSATVLILGESGTGKELFAKLIHSMSSRANRELISINCASIPEALLESELFGHKKGAFTGAVNHHVGLFEIADGSTLFMDEIGDMPLSLQAKMLRVLQEKKIRPVGEVTEKPVNFRLIAATHRDLRGEVNAGKFREDLFYRLNVLPMHIPPLRERSEDIPALISKFAFSFSKKYGLKCIKLSSVAMNNLVRRPWRGNVRELENLIERLTVIYQSKDTIEVEDLPSTDEESTGCDKIIWNFKNNKNLPTVSELTNEYISYVLSRVDLHQGEASQILGLSRRTIYRKIKYQSLVAASQRDEK